ncbi:MAG: aconitase X, partial [Chloroflexota bacterium]|nr:aconitase X [Chloroflexota bacterium]
LLDHRRVHPDVELVISTGRETLASADRDGTAAALRGAGAEILVDTCTYIAPILRRDDGAVMTDSGKWAYYAPGNIGVDVRLASTRDCLESAVAGRCVADASLWAA